MVEIVRVTTIRTKMQDSANDKSNARMSVVNASTARDGLRPPRASKKY